jgi:hypothetical protein
LGEQHAVLGSGSVDELSVSRLGEVGGFEAEKAEAPSQSAEMDVEQEARWHGRCGLRPSDGPYGDNALDGSCRHRHRMIINEERPDLGERYPSGLYDVPNRVGGCRFKAHAATPIGAWKQEPQFLRHLQNECRHGVTFTPDDCRRCDRRREGTGTALAAQSPRRLTQAWIPASPQHGTRRDQARIGDDIAE